MKFFLADYDTMLYNVLTSHQNEESFHAALKDLSNPNRNYNFDIAQDTSTPKHIGVEKWQTMTLSGPSPPTESDIAVTADSRWSFWQFRFGPFGDLCLRNPLPSRRSIAAHNDDNNAALERLVA